MVGAYAQAPEPEGGRRRRRGKNRTRGEEKERKEEKEQDLGLEISRRLVKASNNTTAVLEADAAFSKLVDYSLPHDLPFFERQERLDREYALVALMTAAGRDLMDAFTDLLNARQIWESFASSEQKLGRALASAPDPFRLRMQVAELLSQYLPEVLRSLGYRPPPPAEEWTDLVKRPVHMMLLADGEQATFARNSAKAQYELTFFTRRLRELVEDAEASLEDNQHEDPNSGAFRRYLRAALSAARNRAIPAALGAGVAGAVAGAAGGPAGMAVGAAVGSGTEAIKTIAETAAAGWLADAGPQGVDSAMSPLWVVWADIKTVDDCVKLMESSTDSRHREMPFPDTPQHFPNFAGCSRTRIYGAG
jgi:hypothetical protein